RRRDPGAVGRSHTGAKVQRASVRIEQLGLGIAVEQSVVFVLPGQRKQPVAQLTQLARGGRPTTDPSRPTFADLAQQAHRIEDCFNRGSLRAVANLVGGGPRAGRATKPVDEQRPPAPRTTVRLISWPGANTIGRTVSANGFIGTSTRSSRVGSSIGPPLACAYAVDPLAVATMAPSASITPTRCPPTSISRRRMFVSPEWSTTTSFRPISWIKVRPFRDSVTSSIVRSSIRYEPSKNRPKPTSISSA